MPENETIEEIVETTETDIEVSGEPDILDDVPETEESSANDSENIEESEDEYIEESSEETTEDSVSENDIEELPEDMTEELTEELMEELTEESTEYILYMSEQETEIPFLEKPFTDYSVSEGLLLLIFILLLIAFVRSFFD